MEKVEGEGGEISENDLFSGFSVFWNKRNYYHPVLRIMNL